MDTTSTTLWHHTVGAAQRNTVRLIDGIPKEL